MLNDGSMALNTPAFMTLTSQQQTPPPPTPPFSSLFFIAFKGTLMKYWRCRVDIVQRSIRTVLFFFLFLVIDRRLIQWEFSQAPADTHKQERERKRKRCVCPFLHSTCRDLVSVTRFTTVINRENASITSGMWTTKWGFLLISLNCSAPVFHRFAFMSVHLHIFSYPYFNMFKIKTRK